MRGGVERWRVGCRRAPLWKSVSQGGRIFVRSATRRCCVLQLVVAGTPLQDRRTIQSTQPKSHHLSRTSWRQITHRSVIQRAPEHSCQQRLSSYNAWTHGHNIVLLVDCQRISHLESTACVVFCIVLVNGQAFFVSTRFLPLCLPCVSEVRVAFAIGLCFSWHRCHMFAMLTDILSPTSRVKFFHQRRTQFRVVSGSGMCWMPTCEASDFPSGATPMEASMFGWQSLSM